jgi:hypothetical protein
MSFFHCKYGTQLTLNVKMNHFHVVKIGNHNYESDKDIKTS